MRCELVDWLVEQLVDQLLRPDSYIRTDSQTHILGQMYAQLKIVIIIITLQNKDQVCDVIRDNVCDALSVKTF